MTPCVEIGSLFEYRNNAKKTGCHFFDNYSNILYLRTAREALKIIAVESKKRDIHRVFLPIYCCSSIIQPFKEEEYDVFFYDINNEFEVCKNVFLNNDLNNSVFLVINFFGKKCYSNINRYVGNFKNVITILDCTQSMFDNDLFDDGFDYQIGSIRKWISVPDGAFLTYKSNTFEKVLVNYGSNDFVDNYFSSMKSKDLYLNNHNIEDKSVFLSKYRECVQSLKKPIQIFAMSEISRRIIQSYNFKHLKKTRFNNYQYLCNGLKVFNDKLTLIDFQPKIPFCVVVLVNERDKIQLELANRGIYCQVLWPLLAEAEAKSSYWKSISERILCIPCDQRYNLEQMEYILTNIKDVL